MDRFWNKVNVGKPDECWTWIGCIVPTGYGSFKLPNERKSISSHRYAFYLSYGFYANQTRHMCGNRLCCNPSHLKDGTHKDNAADRKDFGSHIFGQNMFNAKLTDACVHEIRERLDGGEVQQKLADKFGVSQQTISFIKTRKTWTHLL